MPLQCEHIDNTFSGLNSRSSLCTRSSLATADAARQDTCAAARNLLEMYLRKLFTLVGGIPFPVRFRFNLNVKNLWTEVPHRVVMFVAVRAAKLELVAVVPVAQVEFSDPFLSLIDAG